MGLLTLATHLKRTHHVDARTKAAMLTGLIAVGAVGLISCSSSQSTESNGDGASINAPIERVLFGGITLDGWLGDLKHWRAENGEIVGETTADSPIPRNTFLIFGEPIDGDFELNVDVQMIGNNNSGVQYRAERVGDFGLHGYQCDIHPNDAYTGMLYDEGGRGIVAEQGSRLRIETDGSKTALEPTHPVTHYDLSRWHTFTIIARGNRLKHQIDGETAVIVEDHQSGYGSTGGFIGLQLHAGGPYQVRFKNLRVRMLD